MHEENQPVNTPALRQALLLKRRSLDPASQQQAGKQALAQFRQHFVNYPLQRVAVYWAIRGELPTQRLIQFLIDRSCHVFLPRPAPHQQNTLVFAQYHPQHALEPDAFGIPTPSSSAKTVDTPCQLNMIVMPLVAVDTLGNRVGMGKGFYDRTLSQLPCRHQHHAQHTHHTQNRQNTFQPSPLLLGWCYEWQVTQHPLTPAPWDVPLDALITDKMIRWFTKEPIPT